VDSAGNVYVADTGNHSIRKVDTGGNVTTIAGDGTAGFNDANGVSAHFNAPRGVAVDSSGRVYVADTGNHAVRRIEASGNVFTIAGNGTVGSSNGTGTAARFNGLAGITVDGQTVYVYIADTGNHQIRRLDTSAAVILLAGLDRGFKDGTAAQSRFADPVGIAADGAGHIVIAETTNSLVREVDPLLALNAQPNAVYTLAGTGGRGTTNGAGDIAQFNKPGGVAILTSSTVIVADTGNNALRKILLPPVIASLNPTQGNSGTAITITGNRFDERGPSYNTVRFTTSSGTVNATVTTVTRSQINVTVPSGAVTGNVTVQTAGGTSNGVTFTVITTQPPAIADFNPKSGSIGTLVTITGTNLKVGATDPVVSFQGPNSTRLPAAISSATATQVIAIVPNGAVTGLIDLTTSLGTAITASAFIVQLSQDYSLTLAPSSQTTMQGSQAVYIVSATSPQSDFTQLIKLSISGLPSGMQDKFKFEPAQITAGGNSTLTLTVPDSQSPTSYSFTVQGLASLDGNSVARTAGGSLTVMNRNGQTTLSGRVLGTDDKPIMGAHVFIGSATDTTNAAGSFLLTGVAASPPGGQSVISIDATSIIGLPTETYPFINEPAVILSGQANISSYNFYLPRIDWGNSGAVNNLDTSSAPAIITNSNVPGLKMTIPQGVQLIGRNGSAITRASITPVPIDRVPAPLPAEITLVQGQPPVKISTPLVYTSQPGSATVANGAKVPITYPNLGGASPGTVVPLFNFDHADVTWKKYGDGQVSTDGKTIVPINGAGLSDFSWHFPFTGVGADPNDPDCGNHVQTPVDLSTGHKLEIMTDVAFGGARGGISLTRIFTNDLSNPSSTVNTRFGHGMSDNFNIRLFGNYAAGAVRVILPDQMDGRLFTFDSAQGGTRIYKTTATISQLGDVVRWPSDNAQPEYRTKAGTVLRFEQQPGAPQNYRLTTITDRNGNVTTLTYTGNDLTTIKDAVNRELHLTYVSLQDGLGGQMRRYVDTVTDPLNRVTRYYYEYKSDTARWLLRSVVDPLGFTISYTYNRYNWISSVKDARGNFAKRIEYYYVDGIVDPRNNGRVRWQIFADGRKETYQYSYAAQVVTGVKIRSYPNSLPDTTPDDDPQVRVMTRRFNARGYMIAATDALGQPSDPDHRRLRLPGIVAHFRRQRQRAGDDKSSGQRCRLRVRREFQQRQQDYAAGRWRRPDASFQLRLRSCQRQPEFDHQRAGRHYHLRLRPGCVESAQNHHHSGHHHSANAGGQRDHAQLRRQRLPARAPGSAQP
jgi:YD repeat-containing protein